MTLDIQDFVAQVSGNVAVEDIPPAVQERVNGALADLTGEEGGPGGPAGGLYDAVVNTGSGSDDGNSPFKTIQAAVNSVTAGDVISVEAGRYPENVEINTENITIFGAGRDQTTIDATGKERGIAIKEDGVRIQGLTVDNAGKNLTSGEVEGIFVGDAAGFTNTSGDVVIRDVDITNISGGGSDKAAEGIHAKSYGQDKIDGLVIDNVTIDDVKQSTWGADGIKLQADVRNVTVRDSTIRNVEGSWAYGVVLTPSGDEPGIPAAVGFENSLIENISAINFDGVGVGIDSESGKIEPATNGDDVADPNELSFPGSSTIRNADFGIYDKNTDVSLNISSLPTFQSVNTNTLDPTGAN